MTISDHLKARGVREFAKSLQFEDVESVKQVYCREEFIFQIILPFILRVLTEFLALTVARSLTVFTLICNVTFPANWVLHPEAHSARPVVNTFGRLETLTSVLCLVQSNVDLLCSLSIMCYSMSRVDALYIVCLHSCVKHMIHHYLATEMGNIEGDPCGSRAPDDSGFSGENCFLLTKLLDLQCCTAKLGNDLVCNIGRLNYISYFCEFYSWHLALTWVGSTIIYSTGIHWLCP